MSFCINQVTLGEERDFEETVRACSQAGFTAMELWLPSVETYLAQGHSVSDAFAVLSDHGMAAVGACFVMGLLASDADAKRRAFDVARRRFELSHELGAPGIACVGDGPATPRPDDLLHAAERAREVGDLAESFGLVVGVEFVAGFPFLGTLAAAARLVAAADHHQVGVLIDTFHFWAGGSTLADFDALGETPIALVHLNDVRDVPRETLTDADRVLPGDGVMPLADILGRIQATGYDGYYSLELFNRALWDADPVEAARRAYDACQQIEA